MNTTEDVEFNYQTYMDEISLDSVKIHRGTEAREKRREIVIRALACFNRGSAHSSIGAYDCAIAEYRKAIDLKPNYVNAYHSRGNAYMQKGAYDLAILDFDKVIALRPDDAMTYFSRGLAHFIKDKVDLAIKDLNRAVALDSEFAVANFGLGVCSLLSRTDWQVARSYLTLARREGLDIIAAFRKNYENVAAFERRHGVRLPKDIAAMLTP